jgi:hypothetical protein
VCVVVLSSSNTGGKPSQAHKPALDAAAPLLPGPPGRNSNSPKITFFGVKPPQPQSRCHLTLPIHRPQPSLETAVSTQNKLSQVLLPLEDLQSCLISATNGSDGVSSVGRRGWRPALPEPTDDECPRCCCCCVSSLCPRFVCRWGLLSSLVVLFLCRSVGFGQCDCSAYRLGLWQLFDPIYKLHFANFW